ncbi:DUF2262 domain-containing protein [Listeria monocytogenes]|nr:DUF2262 domain-containing protein [Listeria monocytogenes]
MSTGFRDSLFGSFSYAQGIYKGMISVSSIEIEVLILMDSENIQTLHEIYSQINLLSMESKKIASKLLINSINTELLNEEINKSLEVDELYQKMNLKRIIIPMKGFYRFIYEINSIVNAGIITVSGNTDIGLTNVELENIESIEIR